MTDENDLLKEGSDFNYDKDGNFVLTASYLLKRGRCCTSGCENCPYGIHDYDPLIPMELQIKNSEDEEA